MTRSHSVENVNKVNDVNPRPNSAGIDHGELDETVVVVVVGLTL